MGLFEDITRLMREIYLNSPAGVRERKKYSPPYSDEVWDAVYDGPSTQEPSPQPPLQPTSPNLVTPMERYLFAGQPYHPSAGLYSEAGIESLAPRNRRRRRQYLRQAHSPLFTSTI